MSQGQNDAKQLWMGAIQPHWDEQYVMSLFLATGTCTGVKIHRSASHTAGYAFLEFSSHDAAQYVLEAFNGRQIPGQGVVFRLNWGKKKDNDPAAPNAGGTEFNMFVGDLASEVTDQMLEAAFREKYRSILDGKVIIDPASGNSKNYGFVKFAMKTEYDQALIEMNGARIASRTIRVNKATQKKTNGRDATGGAASAAHSMMYGAAYGGYAYPYYGMYGGAGYSAGTSEGAKFTVFVGNLSPKVDEEILRNHFAAIGGILDVNIPSGKDFGFIVFSSREHANHAISVMHGSNLLSSRIRCDWGKSSAGATAAASASSYYQQQQQYQAQMYAAYYPQYAATYGQQQQQQQQQYLQTPAVAADQTLLQAQAQAQAQAQQSLASVAEDKPKSEFESFYTGATTAGEANASFVRSRTSSAPTLSLGSLRSSLRTRGHTLTT